MALLFDEIGYWSEIKLDIIKNYALEYSKILSNQKNPRLHHAFIDAFAGSGKHRSKTTGSEVPGSPQIALDIEPPFKEYFFIDIDGAKVAELRKIASARPGAYVFQGDCNAVLLEKVFPMVRYEDYRRGLCLLDPYGLDLRWQVIETAGHMRSIDMFLNFPVMDMNRNVLWKNPAGVDQSDIERMNAFWGDDSWRAEAYRKQPNLFGEIVATKEDNLTIAAAFKKRLLTTAGFRLASEPLPMRNTIGATVYYLFFASQSPIAGRIMRYIFHKYSRRGIA